MTNQEILANGPEGWTHFGEGEYYKKGKDSPYENPAEDEFFDQGFIHSCGEWVTNNDDLAEVDFRARSDIERIVYLESVLKGEAA